MPNRLDGWLVIYISGTAGCVIHHIYVPTLLRTVSCVYEQLKGGFLAAPAAAADNDQMVRNCIFPRPFTICSFEYGLICI